MLQSDSFFLIIYLTSSALLKLEINIICVYSKKCKTRDEAMENLEETPFNYCNIAHHSMTFLLMYHCPLKTKLSFLDIPIQIQQP